MCCYLIFVCTGVNGLHAFVEVALNATDDDSSLVTLVPDLHTVENAVDKFVTKPCGLNELVTACDEICSDELFLHKLQVRTL